MIVIVCSILCFKYLFQIQTLSDTSNGSLVPRPLTPLFPGGSEGWYRDYSSSMTSFFKCLLESIGQSLQKT